MCITIAVCVFVSSKSDRKNYLSAVYFAAFLIILGDFWQYVKCEYRCFKNSMSMPQKYINADHISQLIISAHDTTAQDLAAIIHQTLPF